MSTDRNLLLGILALQSDLITREQLIAGLNAWVSDKQESLDEILMSQGALREDSRTLLRELVDKHLELHGGSVVQSLAALTTMGFVHDEFRTIADGSQATGGSTSRFRIVRPHAIGGLGEVFLATDAELNREVALKEIQAKFADDIENRIRFRLEAEITGNLEHPGIVPVYGLGQYADGRPFYAMRFIRGDSLKEAIEQFHARYGTASGMRMTDGEAWLELRKLLGRFVDVCNAIEYAHSRGVLHRDLKPGNVVLGKYGETLVVDWGLAKALGRTEQVDASLPPVCPSNERGSAATMLGSAIGTPAYMSPEQAAGRLNELGPATDVYSLGATLYHLLTGQAPIRGQSIAETLQRVQAGNFPSPSQVRTDVPRPLEAICIRAMALQAQNRYTTPLALAEDIERWLADEPVSCYVEPWALRVRRFVRRHQVAVSGAAAATVVLVVSLAAGLGLIARHNAQLGAANRQLDSANQQLNATNRELAASVQREQAARELAVKNENQALANAAVAREQSHVALKTLETVIFEIQTELTNVSGAGDLRRKLIQTAISRLEQISDQFVQRSAIDRDTALALDELGDLLLRIGTSGSVQAGSAHAGSGAAASSGHTVDTETATVAARKLFERSLAIRRQLAADDSSDVLAQRDLATAYTSLGNVQLRSGQVTEALASYQQALEIGQKSAAADPNNTQIQRDLSIALNKLGEVQLLAGQVSGALRSFQQGLEFSQRLATADPANGQAQRDLSISYTHVGDVQRQAGHVAEALLSYQQGLEIRKELAATDSGDAQLQRDLVVAHSKLGDAQLQSGQTTEALESYQRGIQISQKLATADPNDTQAQRDLSVLWDNLGDVRFQSGQATEALGAYRHGWEIRQKLAAADPTDASAQRDLSVSFSLLGDAQMQCSQVAEALASYQRSLEIRQKLAAADPSNIRAQRELSVSCSKLGDVQLRSGQVADALAAYQKTIEISQKLAAADPNDAQAQFDLYISNAKLGEANQRGNRLAEAIAWYERALQVLRDLDQSNRLADAQKAQMDLMERRIQQCRDEATALGDWQMLLQQPAIALPALLERRAIQFVQDGRSAEAVQAVAKLRELGTGTGDQLYNAACIYSLVAAGIQAEKDELSPDQAAARQQHIRDALAALREAIATGYQDFAHMRQDPDLAVLRELAEFRKLLETRNER